MAIAVTPVSDTTVYIFDYKFKVKIPNLQTQSVEYIRFFGVPTTGDSQIDQALKEEWITTMLPISQMVTYSNEGIPIKVCSYEDIKTIYNYISLHLNAWKNQIGNGINIGDAPIDDLIALDAFANVVYDHAKFQFDRSIADSILARHIGAVTKFNKHNFFKPEINIAIQDGDITKINEIVEDIHPERESLADIFKDRKIGARKWS